MKLHKYIEKEIVKTYKDSVTFSHPLDSCTLV